MLELQRKRYYNYNIVLTDTINIITIIIKFIYICDHAELN